MARAQRDPTPDPRIPPKKIPPTPEQLAKAAVAKRPTVLGRAPHSSRRLAEHRDLAEPPILPRHEDDLLLVSAHVTYVAMPYGFHWCARSVTAGHR